MSISRHAIFVLISGGLDSTTTLAKAKLEFPKADVYCVTFDYGQRHKKEAQYASVQAKLYGAQHEVIKLPPLLTGMLVDKGENNEAIPNASYAQLGEGISPTYVSFRNGTMLSILAAKAQSWVMEQEKQGHQNVSATIYCGVHADDAAGDAYPDCTLEFVGAMANAIQVGTYGKVRLRAPLVAMDKAAVVLLGANMGIEFAYTWSCYVGEEEHCGTCPTCRARKEAFILAGVEDPTEYAA